MEAIEEVAYRNRPPLLEDVSIQGPLRIPVRDAMQTLEEREAIEADFRWYRYSKCAAPCLLFAFFLAVALFALTAWQQVGNLKVFDAHNVRSSEFPQGVPRLFVREAEGDSDDEAGLPKNLRNLRIAAAFIAFFGVVFTFATLLTKPRPRTRKILNFVWALFFFAAFVLAVISFGIGIDTLDRARQCPFNFRVTFEMCTSRRGTAIVTTVLDAALALGSIVTAILLVRYTASGDWKLFRTGWRQRERDAEFEVVKRTNNYRKVRPVRITLLTIFLFFTLFVAIVLAVFVTVLHQDRDVEEPLTARGRDLNELTGWPARNSRLRYALSSITILAVLLNLIPFTHRAIAYIFALIYFTVAVLCFVTFGFDVHEMQEADDLACPIGIRCTKAPYIGTAILEFILGLLLLSYILYEYVAKAFTTSRWSGRHYAPHEIKKHDQNLDSLRPVRDEITGKVMTAKDYVYRWRFIAGTQPVDDPLLPAGPVYSEPPIADYGPPPPLPILPPGPPGPLLGGPPPFMDPLAGGLPPVVY